MTHKFPIEMKAELDSPRRKRLFDSEKALKSLGIKNGMTVADVGCGTGFFTIPLANLVGPEGKVLAIDISSQMLKDIKKRIKDENLENIKVVLSKENKIPLRSGKVNYCLLSSVVHELENKVLFFRELKRLLKSNGRIGIIEWKKIPSPIGPPLKEKIPVSVMRHIIIKNGFNIGKTINLGKYNYGITATKI